MFSKITKLPLLLILSILLALVSTGFALVQNKELTMFRDSGLFVDTNLNQVVMYPIPIPSNGSLTRYIGIKEIKEYISGNLMCPSNLNYGNCYSSSISNYVSQSSIIYPQYMSSISSVVYDVPINTMKTAKYYGWFGSDKVEFTINTPVENYKYNGTYYSNSEKVTYNFAGNNQTDNYGNNVSKTSIRLDEITDGLVTGKIELNSQDNTNKLAGLSIDATDKFAAENLFGTYTAKDQKNYDIFLTKNKQTVDAWKIIEVKGKYYSDTNTNYYSNNNSIVYIKGESENYFSNELWNFKNLVDGQEVIIKAKTRVYTPNPNNGGGVANYYPPTIGQGCGEGGCGGNSGAPKPGYPTPFSTNAGLFNIESVIKI